ncbi:MAG: GNAT family N-acetyltransferase [Halieaceae bacterium]|jgi:GNAT superfamily N-acetyltransferase|nr:GNAT family N-acetyltransferase [Halieaceae bacterium]
MLTIRNATPADTAQILAFVHGLARYEKAEHEVVATEDDLHQALFGDDAVAAALLCETDGEAIGFALYFYNFSTWTGKRGIFLEDLFVDPGHRGKGAGKALLTHLARIAVARNCGRFEWNVLDWNEPSIRFYESLGAKPLSEWVGYRLTGEALHTLAEETP